jgi:hypothetical protein
MRRTHLGSQDRVVLTRRTSSTVMCGWPEGNGGGGRRPGWWSAAHGAGRSYSAARCSGCGRICRREAGVGCPWWLNGGGHRAGWSDGEGPLGLSRPELEGSQRCTGVGWSLRRRRSGRVVAGGGDARRTGVRQSMLARCKEKTDVGCERKTKVENGELIGRVLPL